MAGDHGGRSAAEVGVAGDVAAELRLNRSVGIVKDQAIAVDVVGRELVVRQPSGVGPGDVDDRHSVARPVGEDSGCGGA